MMKPSESKEVGEVMLSSEISVQALNDRLHDSALVLLYTSMKGAPAQKSKTVAQHPSAYIPGSRLFDFQSVIVDKTSPLSNTMPSSTLFEREAQRIGINNDSDIVVYDDFGNFCASRVWFMLKSMGHKHVRVLQGGLGAWLTEGLNTEPCLNENCAKGNFIAKPSREFQFVDSDFVATQTLAPKNNKLVLIDARSPERFSGKQPEVKAHLKSGHIPHSLNLYYKHLQNDDGRFLAHAKLNEQFNLTLQCLPEGDKTSKAMSFSCGSGVTACILAQAASELGYGPLYVYDGSWSDWGADERLPVSTSHETESAQTVKGSDGS
jgi:thiosulfate/3-mercaptopyruvate sulfurtransferase